MPGLNAPNGLDGPHKKDQHLFGPGGPSQYEMRHQGGSQFDMNMGGRSKSHGGPGWQGQPPFMDGPEDGGFLYPRDGGAPQNVSGGHGNSAMIVTPQQGKYQPY